MDQVLSTFLGSPLFILSATFIAAVAVPGMTEAKAKGILTAAGVFLVLQVFLQASTLEPAQRVYVTISATVLVGVVLRLFFLWAFYTEENYNVAPGVLSVPQPHFTFDNIKKEFIWKENDILTMMITGTVSVFPPLRLWDIYIELNGQGYFREQIQGDWWAENRIISGGEIPFSVDIPSHLPCGAYRANLFCADRDLGEDRLSNIFHVDIPSRPTKT